MRVPRLSCLLTLCIILSLCAAASPAVGEKPVVHFGVNLRYDPIVMYEHYQPMMDYLTSTTPYRFELKISQNYQEAIQFLASGKTQVASLGDGAVMQAIQCNAAVPILKPLNAQGKPLYRTLFVAPADSPIASLQDLKGKRVALGYYHSLTGNLFARRALEASGLKSTDFAALNNLRNHSSVAKAVLKGEADAGALKDVVASMYLKHGLKVIAASPEYPSTPLVAGRNTPPAVVAALSAALVKLDRSTPRDRALLEQWDAEYSYGFEPVRPGDYRATSRLFRSIPNGCGTGCHR